MKYWQLFIIYIFILAMPISTWANVMVMSHCQSLDNTSHSIHTKMSASESIQGQMHGQHDQVTMQDSSAHLECDCGCGGDEFNCSISSCSAVALTNTIEMISFNTTQFMQQGTETLAFSPDPHLLLRPPITLS